MKKKVCHITSVHPANDIRIYHKECISLAEKGYQVHLVAVGNIPEKEKKVIHHPIPINTRSGRLRRILFRSWRAYQIAKSIDAKVYHFHDPELLPYGLLLKWKGYTVIYDAHEDVPRDVMIKGWIPLVLRKPISWFIEKLENFISRRLDVIVAATPLIGERFKSIGANNVVEVKNFPRLDELSSDTEKNTNQESVPYLCYVGLISLERGILEMIRAIEPLNVKLILAGSFNNPNTEQLARSLSGWSKVEYHKHLSRQEVAKVYSKSHLGLCLLHPTQSYVNSLPIKLFEYMSSGLPVLASNFPLWRDIVEKQHCGVCVQPLNITEIQQGIEKILSNSELSSLMGENGKKSVAECFNWQFEEQKLLSTYEQFSNILT